jgi:hypothetical protein
MCGNFAILAGFPRRSRPANDAIRTYRLIPCDGKMIMLRKEKTNDTWAV